MLFWVFVEMDRDEVVSYMGRTEPGHITWDKAFFERIVIYVVLSSRAILFAQLPQLGGIGRSIGELVTKALP
jgi:hypothetical protein